MYLAKTTTALQLKKKKTLKQTFISKGLHGPISYDPCFVHFKKHCMSCTSTAISKRYIHSQEVKLFNCLFPYLVSLSLHQSGTEVNGTTFDVLSSVVCFHFKPTSFALI